MPKDEFDFEDPLGLNGVSFLTEEDTTETMCECFIEEFMRMGYNANQVLALFRNPQYLGMNLVLEKRGEQFVRNAITDIFGRWGRTADFPGLKSPTPSTLNPSDNLPAQPITLDGTLTDPMGSPIPKLNL